MSPIPEVLRPEMFAEVAGRQLEHAFETMKKIKNTSYSIKSVPDNYVLYNGHKIGCAAALLLERNVIPDLLGSGNSWAPVLNHFHNLILDPEALKQLKTLFGIRIHLPGGEWHNVTISNSEGVTICLNTSYEATQHAPWNDEATIIANLAIVPNELWHGIQGYGFITGKLTGDPNDRPWKAQIWEGVLPDRKGILTGQKRNNMHYPVDISAALQTAPSYMEENLPIGIFWDTRTVDADERP